MLEVDWQKLFVPSGSLAEIVVRATTIYLVLFLVFRFLPRRTLGQASPPDLLILVLIADAVQNGMSGEYRSITEGLLVAATIIGWAVAFDWLDHRFPHWHITGGEELPLIEDGRLLRQNMARQLVTEDEILAQLRQHGLDSPRNIRRAFIEGDGSFTLLLRSGRAVDRPKGERAP